ncbi:MAG: hypothetical protein QM479_04515 [Pseudomonadota bacterium]
MFFKNNKIASVLWMLILALGLVLVDYFLSPVVTENAWKYNIITEQLSSKDRELLAQVELQQLSKDKAKLTLLAGCVKVKSNILDSFIAKYAKQNYTPLACLKNGDIIVLKQSRFKGVLMIYQYDKLVKIARNLHQAKFLKVSNKDEIYIWEKGRERLIQFSFNKP